MAGTASPSPVLFLVDDDAGLLRLMEKALRREGLATATAASGKEALEWLQQHTADLMLLDLKLQDIEGKELINHLTAINRRVPFIIITGQGDERVAVEMMRRGALDYLVKDVAFLQFLPEVVRRALGQLEKEKKLAKAEHDLQTSEQRFRRLFECAQDGILLLDVDTGEITDANRFIFELLGYSREEMLGRKLWEVGAFKDIAASQAGFLELRNKKYIRYDNLPLEARDGQLIAVEFVSNVYQEDGIKVIQCNVRDIRERKRLENEVLDISDREQRRIAQDLHDGLGQQLAGIACLCDALKQDMAEQKSPQTAAAAKVARLLNDAVAQTRGLARGLYPVEAKPDGLMHALAELAERTTDIFRVDCQLLCPRPIRVECDSVATHLYRIAQEAVTNAIKHGQAKWIEIGLAATPQRIILAVKSDGANFRKTARPSSKGMGLRIMEYRAGLIGGSLLVQRRPEGGTEVICTLNRAPAALPRKT